MLRYNFSIQPNDILDESNKVYDFLRKPQFQNSSNTDNLGLEMEWRDRNRGPTAEDGGKEYEGKPISKAENLLMSSSRIQTEEEAERLRLDMGRRDTNRPRRQMMKRSTMIAKQVISIQSALTLGFVSQLWVDTTSVSSLSIELTEIFIYHYYLPIVVRIFRNIPFYTLLFWQLRRLPVLRAR